MPTPRPISPRRARRALAVLAWVLAAGAAHATPGLADGLGFSAMPGIIPPGVAVPTAGEAGPVKETSGGLEALILADQAIRPGGREVVVVDVADGASTPTDGREVVLDIQPGGGVQVVAARGEGWSCGVRAPAARCASGRIAGDVGGARIEVTLVAPAGLRAASVPLVAGLAWRDATTGVRRTQQATGTVPVDPPLTVDAALVGSSPVPVMRDDRGSVAVLKAVVTGLGEEDVALRWSQSCLTAVQATADAECRGRVSPRAEFMQPVTDGEADALGTQSVRLPYTDDPSRLVFRATVGDDGMAVGDAVVITTDPIRPERYAPRTAALEKALRGGVPTSAGPGVGERLPLVRGGVSGAGPTTVKPGGTAMLEARVQGGKPVSVTWAVSRGPREVLKGSSASGSRLALRPPASLAGTTAIITATAVLRNGDRVQLPELVVVGDPAPKPSQRMMEAARTVLPADAPPPRQVPGQQSNQIRPTTTVCALVEAVRRGGLRAPPVLGSDQLARAPADITFPEGARLWLGPGVVASGTGCTADTTITFTQGTVALGRMGFQAVSGRISSRDGLVITRAALRPPDEWAQAVPSLAPAIDHAATRLAMNVPSGATVGAGLNTDGTWRRLGGEFQVPTGIELLPLPRGWTFRPARVRIEEGGFLGLTIEAAAPAGQSGSARLSGVVGPSGEAEIEVSAAGIGVLRQSDGTQVTVNAAGELSLSWADDPSAAADAPLRLVVDPEVSGSVQNVRLADNFLIREAGFTWSPGAIDVRASVRAGTQNNFLDLTAEGRYAGADDWGLDLRAQGSWEVIGGVRIEGLAGRVTRQAGITTVSASGRATGWQPSSAFRVNTLEAALTNQCPANTPRDQCNPSAVRVDLTADGQLALPGASTVAWRSTASVNLATRRFTLTGGLDVADGAIGPAPLRLRRVAITVSNENAAGLCTPTGPGATSPPDATRVSLTALGTVLGQAAEFTGEFGGGNLCLVGTLGQMPASVPQASSFSGIRVAYSSTNATLTAGAGGAGVAAGAGQAAPLRAGEVTVVAGFRLPDSVAALGVRGTGLLVGSLGLADGSVSADISFALPDRPVLFGQATASHLGLDGVRFRFCTRTGFSFSASAEMSYVTPAAQQGGQTIAAASTTPLTVTAAFENGSAVIAGGVDAARAAGDRVDNAFGVNDLTVRRLAVSASVGRTQSVAFDADVTLPARWGQPIGIRPNSRVRLAASVSQENPCLEFDIRRDPEDRQMAVDLANAGLLQARRMGLVLAPSGCSIGAGPLRRDIAPGFGVAFDGLIGGYFEVRVDAQIQLPTPQRPTALSVNAELRIGEFSLGSAVRVRQTNVRVAFDTTTPRYELAFSGGIDVLGNTVNIAADFRAAPGAITFQAAADANLSVLGFGLNGRVSADLRASSRGIERLAFSGDLAFRVLGINVARTRVDLDYDQGVVQRFYLRMGLSVNVLLASARGDLEINYERSGQALDTLVFRVGLRGQLRFLFVRRAFDWTIVQWGPRRIGSARNPDQGVSWSETDREQVRGPSVEKLQWFAGRVRQNDITRFTTSLQYETAYRVASAGAEAPTGDARGRLLLESCVFQANRDDRCAPGSRRTFPARVDFTRRRAIVEGGLEFCTPQLCANGTDAIIQGDGWRALVREVERARREFAAAHPGRVLPPLRTWSVDRQPVALAAASFGTDVMTWDLSAGIGDIPRAAGGRVSALPSRAVNGSANPPALPTPITGDWNGDGVDSVGVFVPELGSLSAAGTWHLLGDGGRVSEVRRGTCSGSEGGATGTFCQPVEPPGSAMWDRTPANARGGARGALYPVSGDWNGRGNDGIVVDDLGMARLVGDTLAWELWPQGDAPERVVFGRRDGSRGVVDRPITGDWDGDGRTDLGIYTPPARPGDVGTVRLRLLPAARAQDASADTTIRMGDYGERPVTGDWNNDGIDDVAMVSRSDGRTPSTWRLRYLRTESCESDCAPDATVRYGVGEVPIAGRWG